MCRYLYDFVFFEAVFSYLHRFVTICFNLQLFAAICNYSMLYKFVMCFLNVWHVIWMYDVTYEGIVCDIHVWYAMWCIVVGCAVVEHSLWAHVWPGRTEGRTDGRADVQWPAQQESRSNWSQDGPSKPGHRGRLKARRAHFKLLGSLSWHARARFQTCPFQGSGLWRIWYKSIRKLNDPWGRS